MQVFCLSLMVQPPQLVRRSMQQDTSKKNTFVSSGWTRTRQSRRRIAQNIIKQVGRAPHIQLVPHITTHQENISSHLVSIRQRAPNHHGWSLWLTAKPAAHHRHSRWLTGLSQSQSSLLSGSAWYARRTSSTCASSALICRELQASSSTVRSGTLSDDICLDSPQREKVSAFWCFFPLKRNNNLSSGRATVEKITNQSAVIACHAEKTTHL